MKAEKLISIDLSGAERKRPSEFRIKYLNEDGDACIVGAYDEDDLRNLEEMIEEMDGEVIEIEEYPKA